MNEIQELYDKGRKEWLEGRHLDALKSFLSITEKGHGYCGANINAAVVLTSLGRHKEAETRFREAFATCPEDIDLLFNYSLHLLSKGKWEEGLRLYENRSWNIRPPGDEWDGSPCKTLLVVPEQGNGDCVQFARFLPEARKRCEKIILMCFGSLVRLFESSGLADEVIEFNPGDEFLESEGESNGGVPYEKFTRIMSLPHLVGSKGFGESPYLRPDHGLVKSWSDRMRGDRLKVGLCWRGSKRKQESSAAVDARRSMRLPTMSKLLDIEGVEFHSLQKDAEESDPRMRSNMQDSADFADTAAMMKNLDLVISVDTAVAHVAGAVGTPTWLLNRHDSCWRWGFSGDCSPWYPKMRIFRQREMMEWKPVIEDVSHELKKMVDSRAAIG